MGDRGVQIGGSVIGDDNVTEVRYRKVTLPAAESVDIGAELAALRDLLAGTGDRQTIANALAEAAASSAASRGQVSRLCRQGACNPQSSSPQNRSTHGRSSISHVQALRGWSRMAT